MTITEAVREQIRQAVASGQSQRAAAQSVGVSKSTVAAVLRAAAATGPPTAVVNAAAVASPAPPVENAQQQEEDTMISPVDASAFLASVGGESDSAPPPLFRGIGDAVAASNLMAAFNALPEGPGHGQGQAQALAVAQRPRGGRKAVAPVAAALPDFFLAEAPTSPASPRRSKGQLLSLLNEEVAGFGPLLTSITGPTPAATAA
jgi:hypothetical protein